MPAAVATARGPLAGSAGADEGRAGPGLSIARWVAGAHGGTLTLRERPAGSLFEVALPAPV